MRPRSNAVSRSRTRCSEGPAACSRAAQQGKDGHVLQAKTSSSLGHRRAIQRVPEPLMAAEVGMCLKLTTRLCALPRGHCLEVSLKQPELIAE